MEDKSWAVNLSQEEFEHEFLRRHAKADFIPDKNVWLGMPEAENRLIDGVMPDDFESDLSKPARPDPPPELYCQGCKKVFILDDYKNEKAMRMGHMAHTRKCKKLLEVKI